MIKLKFFLIIFGIIAILLIIYFTIYNDTTKENISLELDFYKDDISPVYCLPWDLLPELHDVVNKLINKYTLNLPKGDLYYLHDKIPEYKMRFDEADKNILQLGKKKMQYYTIVEANLRDYIGNGSSRMVLENNSSNQLSDGKWRLNGAADVEKFDPRIIHINTEKGQIPIKLTGTFYYPPGGGKEWHTNRISANTPDWRFYFIYLTDPNTESYFCYINPITGKFHRMREKIKLLIFFI